MTEGSQPVPPLNDLLLWLVESGASDLHLSRNTPPVFRRNGMLAPAGGVAPLGPRELQQALEIMTDDVERERLETTRELDKALDVPNVGRFRVNVAFERGHLYFSFRHVKDTVMSIEELGLPAICDRLTQLPRGLVIVTGPTGSGKSTTLASMIDRINTRDARHIITIEDPIEFLHDNRSSIIEQREVGVDTRSFAEALRHVLRQDPDVILVGEMRDLETMSSAITAAETGHLVFATLHTPDAPQTIDRIVDAFPTSQQQQVRLQLSMAVEGILSQVLIPTDDGEGRVAACEVMLGTPAIRNLIRESKTHQVPMMMATGSALGMRTLDQELANLVRARSISRETALAYARSPEELGRLLAGQTANAA
jgi:twitching motility protein PilT